MAYDMEVRHCWSGMVQQCAQLGFLYSALGTFAQVMVWRPGIASVMHPCVLQRSAASGMTKAIFGIQLCHTLQCKSGRELMSFLQIQSLFMSSAVPWTTLRTSTTSLCVWPMCPPPTCTGPLAALGACWPMIHGVFVCYFTKLGILLEALSHPCIHE